MTYPFDTSYTLPRFKVKPFGKIINPRSAIVKKTKMKRFYPNKFNPDVVIDLSL